MTKYVLNSGGLTNQPARKKKFHNELVKGLGTKPKFLLCNFAQPRENWEVKFEGYSNSISEDMPDTLSPSFALAMTDTFAEQCRKADIIYIHGGDDHLIQYWMRQFDLVELFKDKIVATNSAGSNLLVTHYWTCDWRQCSDGLGILPIKFIPHFNSSYGADDSRGPINWNQAKKDLEQYGDKQLPIYALEEGEYIIFEE